MEPGAPSRSSGQKNMPGEAQRHLKLAKSIQKDAKIIQRYAKRAQQGPQVI